MAKKLITEEIVRRAHRSGNPVYIDSQSIMTPSARDVARSLSVEVTTEPSGADKPANAGIATAKRLVAIGSDHGGYEMKEELKKYLSDKGYQVKDVGTYSKSPVDYPDYALMVAELVSTGECWRGIMVDGAGIGSCMAANKVPGVRAASCYDITGAINSREHNDANYLTLGAGMIGLNVAKQVAAVWLKTGFGGGRHANRVEKIKKIEKRYLKQ